MSDTKSDDALGREEFLNYIAGGTPRGLAGNEVGWTPRRLKLELADPEFEVLVEHAEMLKDDSVEKMLFEQAMKGVFPAIQMWLLNRRPEQWRDIKKIEIRTEGQVSINVVHSAREALKAAMQDNPSGTIAALQNGALKAIETTAREGGDG